MALFSRLFHGKWSSNSQAAKNDSPSLESFKNRWKAPLFTEDQIRVAVLHQTRNKKSSVLFDSSSLVVTPARRCKVSRKCVKGAKYQHGKPSSDTKLLGSMVFGEAPIWLKTESVKVHSLRNPPQMILTRVFINKPPAEHHDFPSPDSAEEVANNDDISRQMSASYDASVASSGVTGSAASPCRGEGWEEHLTTSLPLNIPRSSSDSGFSVSVASSPGSSSLGSVRSICLSRHKRMCRAEATDLERLAAARHDDDTTAAKIAEVRRRDKLAVSVIFTLHPCPLQQKRFQEWLFSHMPLVAGHMWRLKRAVESAVLEAATSDRPDEAAFIHKCLLAVRKFRSCVRLLYCAPRLPDPVWLGLMAAGSWTRSRLCSRFANQLMELHRLHDTKTKGFFLTSLITAVLTHHLAWIPTVTPTDRSPGPLYQQKHSATWVDLLTRSHPYNPLWAQLSDLYGDLSDPVKVARTVVVGKRADLVCQFLFVLSYFMRCSEVQESFFNAESIEAKVHQPEFESAFKTVDRSTSFVTNPLVVEQSSVMTSSIEEEEPQVSTPVQAKISKLFRCHGCHGRKAVSRCHKGNKFRCPVCGREVLSIRNEGTLEDVEGLRGEENADGLSSLDCGKDSMFSCSTPVSRGTDDPHYDSGKSQWYLSRANRYVGTSEVGCDGVENKDRSRTGTILTGVETENSAAANSSSKHDEKSGFEESYDSVISASGASLGVTTDKEDSPTRPRVPSNASSGSLYPSIDFLTAAAGELTVASCSSNTTTTNMPSSCLTSTPAPKANLYPTVSDLPSVGPYEGISSASGCVLGQGAVKGYAAFDASNARRSPSAQSVMSQGSDASSATEYASACSGDSVATSVDSVKFCPAMATVQTEELYKPQSHQEKEEVEVEVRMQQKTTSFSVDGSDAMKDAVEASGAVVAKEAPMLRSLSPVRENIRHIGREAGCTAQIPPSSFVRIDMTKTQGCGQFCAMPNRDRDSGMFDGDATLKEAWPSETLDSGNLPELDERYDSIPYSSFASAGPPSICFDSGLGGESSMASSFAQDCPDNTASETESTRTESGTVAPSPPDAPTESNTDSAAVKSAARPLTLSMTSSCTREGARKHRRSLSTGSDVVSPGFSSAVRAHGEGRHRKLSSRSMTPTDFHRRRHLSSSSQTSFDLTDPSLDLLPLPLIDVKADNPPTAPAYAFGQSLMGGYSGEYVPDFVLHGTGDPDVEAKVTADVRAAVQGSRPGGDNVAEAVCIVADTDTWEVRVYSSRLQKAGIQVPWQGAAPANCVSSALQSAANLWKLKPSPDFLVMHLEDALQQVLLKSRILAEQRRLHSGRLTPNFMATVLGLHESDLPLLRAAAATQSLS